MVVVIQGEGVIFFNRKSSIKKLKFGCGFAALRSFVVKEICTHPRDLHATPQKRRRAVNGIQTD
jgi:hypothetical protein